MLWILYKQTAKAMLKSMMAAVTDRRAAVEQQATVVQLGRIIQCVKQANELHPAWLKQQYGDIDTYLERHLSVDDWQYTIQIRYASVRGKLPVAA